MSEEENKPSPAEQKARSSGWVPQDEWKGNEGDWVDASEFNLRGELMGRINEQSSIINHLKSKVSERDTALKDVMALQETISKREYDKALKELKAQKAEALRDDDFEGVVNLDEQIDELKTKKPEPISTDDEGGDPASNSSVPPEIEAWLIKPENSWYHTDTTLRSIADGIATGLQEANPDISPSRLIEEVDKKLREELPHRFNTNTDSGVDEGGEYTSSPRDRGKQATFKDLTSEQQEVCKRFEKIGLMTRKAYIESLQQAGEL